MISQILMDIGSFDSIWYTGSTRLSRIFRFRGRGHCFAGVWTGPQQDLICVKHCETNEEANKWLSPRAYTIVGAVFKAFLKMLKDEDSRVRAWLRLRYWYKFGPVRIQAVRKARTWRDGAKPQSPEGERR